MHLVNVLSNTLLIFLTPAPPPKTSKPSFTLCSYQDLTLSHLKVHEQIALTCSLWGHSPQPHALQNNGFTTEANLPLHKLTTRQLRRFNYQLALRPAADFVIIDDLAHGLSPHARRDLLYYIQATAVTQPSTIIYATNDLTTLQLLKAETVWQRDADQAWHLWSPDADAAEAYTAAAFELIFATPQHSARFCTLCKQHSKHFGLLIPPQLLQSGHSIEVQVDHPRRLTDLMLAAGSALIDFQIHPLSVHNLSGQPLTEPTALPDFFQEAGNFPAEKKLSLTQRWGALWQIGRWVWRRHFRSFWKACNLVLSSLYTLLFLLLFSMGTFQVAHIDSSLAAGVLLAAAAGMSVIWGVEGMFWITLPRVDEHDVTAQSPFPTVSLTPLLPFDNAPVGRTGLVSGQLLGHLLIALTHSAVLWPFWIMFFPAPRLLVVSFIFWLLLVTAAWAPAILLGGFARSSSSCFLVGIFAYAGILATAVSLLFFPSVLTSLAWLWPVTGYVLAFSALHQDYVNASQVFWPFIIASVTTALLWWAALRYFLHKPTYYSDQTVQPDQGQQAAQK